MKPWNIVLFAVLIGVVGCEPKPLPKVDSAVPVLAENGAPVTIEEAKEYAKKLEQAVKDKDASKFHELFPYAEIGLRAMSDIPMPKFDRQTLDKLDGSFSSVIFREVEKGSYRLVRIREVDGKPEPIFRMEGDSGMNYHFVQLTRNRLGKVVAADMYVVLTGENISLTWRRMSLQFLTATEKQRLTGTDQLYVKHIGEIREYCTHVREERMGRALAIYRKWPAELQMDKLLHLFAIMASARGDEEEYIRLMEGYQKAHPNDASLALVMIDYLLLKKKHDECLKSLERLKATVGDAYLDSLRANVLVEMGKIDEAKKMADRAVESLPDFIAAYWPRVTIALKEKKHDETVLWLKQIVEKFDQALDFEEIEKNAVYAQFIETQQYEDFKGWYDERAKK